MKLHTGLSFFRVLAIIFVFLLHFKTLFLKYFLIQPSFTFFFNLFHTGYLGVFMFFVLSGFLFYNKFKSGQFHLLKYFKNRILRIYPSYFVVIVLSFICLKTFNIANVTSTDFIQTLFLYFYSFNGNYSPVLPVSWSLEIEFVFYLLVPFLVYFIGSRIHIIILFYIFCYLLSIVFIEQLVLYNYFKAFRFFALGFLLAEFLERYARTVKIPKILSVFLFFLSIIMMVLFIENIIFDLAIALLFFTSYLYSFGSLSNMINYVADRVYSVYLIHLPVIFLYLNILKYVNKGEIVSQSIYILIIHICISFYLTIALSNLLYKYVENRFR
jgi:exopolysaccharide production protein ExoZ